MIFTVGRLGETDLVLGEELIPLLQELVQVVGHVIIRLGQFVAE